MLKLCKNKLHGRNEGGPGWTMLGCVVICMQPDGPQGFQKHPPSKGRGKEAWNNPSRLQSSQISGSSFPWLQRWSGSQPIWDWPGGWGDPDGGCQSKSKTETCSFSCAPNVEELTVGMQLLWGLLETSPSKAHVLWKYSENMYSHVTHYTSSKVEKASLFHTRIHLLYNNRKGFFKKKSMWWQ